MGKLTFKESNHTYLLDGAILPSVTTILRPLSNEIYNHIDPEILRFAADKGTKVHFATELYDTFGIYEIDENLKGFLDAYIKFKRDYKVEVISVEKRSYHHQLFYAGTIDRILLINNKIVLVDIKTTNEIHESLVSIQVSAYEQMECSNGEKIDEIAVLKLNKDGTYVFQYLNRSFDDFLALYKVHMMIKKVKEK